jgi:hypothetical protein
MIKIEKILEKQRAWQAVSADDESLISAIASESFATSTDAIAILSENLREIGYTWVSSESIPVHGLEENIQRIEAKTGLSVPKILVEFWKIIGGISMVDLKTYQHVDFWGKYQIVAPKGFADGLHVDACNNEWAAYICHDYDDWKNFQRQDEFEKFLLSLSPDGFHKDNISGGMPYGVFAESSWKPIWQYFEWSGPKHPVTALADPPDFLSYLRTTILECAGFPALLGIPAFDTLKENLLEGVPIF